MSDNLTRSIPRGCLGNPESMVGTLSWNLAAVRSTRFIDSLEYLLVLPKFVSVASTQKQNCIIGV